MATLGFKESRGLLPRTSRRFAKAESLEQSLVRRPRVDEERESTMSSDAPFLPVGTASVSFIDQQGTFALHVFSTDGYTVTDRVIGSGAQGWSTGAFNQPGGAVSATSWVDADGGHIRVYCTNEDETTEWCLDGTSSTSWYQGGYTLS